MMGGPACPASCPFVAASRESFDFPIGQVRRVAAADGEVDETKRNVLKLAAVAGALGIGLGGAVGGGLQFLLPPPIGISSYPRVQLLDTDGSPLTVAKVEAEYTVDTAELYLFNYPLRNEPNFLLNLYPANGLPPSGSNPGAANVPGGIGTNGSIVAYSAICQHLGCPAPALMYYPPGACPNTPGGKPFYIHCTCHGSTYDVTNSAANLTGPAVLPLPQVTLATDQPGNRAGNIFATSEVGPPVNGHLDTLQGDYPVGSTTPLAKESPITPYLCAFPT
jgi:Rieske Fe-S protein